MSIGHTLWGTGPALVVVMHEWLGDCTNYDTLLPCLDTRAFRFCFVDLRGYGKSIEQVGRYTLDEACADVIALADSLQAARLHLVGHSMSALVAQRLAVLHPGRVKSLVAITPVFAAGFPADASTLERLRAVATEDEAALEAIAARTGHRHTRPWLEFKLRLSRTRSTAAARLGYLKMFTGTDFRAEAQGLPTPMLVLHGEHDIPVYREDALRASFGACYPNVSFEQALNAGHYPMLETPVFVASKLNGFLAAHEDPQGAAGAAAPYSR
jgi:pimeloyl-ACP methyl ester carboxylesterase